MVMTSLKRHQNYILKFDFVIISFKNHHHGTTSGHNQLQKPHQVTNIER